MMRQRAWAMLLCVAAAAIACAAEIGESRDVGAQAEGAKAAIVYGDAVSALLAAVRVDDPLLCALAVGRIDQRGRWSRWGDGDEALPAADSVTTATLDALDRGAGGAADVPRLAAALRDSTPCVRRVAASLLSRIEEPAASGALGEALTDARAEVRALAALATGMSETTAHAAVLGRLLSDADAGVRQSAAWALGATRGRGSMEELMTLLARDPDARVRQAAAWAVGQVASR